MGCEFKIGDLIEFIPENFSRSEWKYCYIGVGYIEKIDYIKTYRLNKDEESPIVKIYHIFCGKVIKQQMNNFAELESQALTIQLTEKQLCKVCRKADLNNLENY